mgnify:FL=1
MFNYFINFYSCSIRQIAVYQHLHVVASQRHVNLTKETNKTQKT